MSFPEWGIAKNLTFWGVFKVMLTSADIEGQK